MINYVGYLMHKDRKKHKYVAKIKNSNGKYRYFYTNEEYEAYLENRKIKNDDPQLMPLYEEKTKRGLFTDEVTVSYPNTPGAEPVTVRLDNGAMRQIEKIIRDASNKKLSSIMNTAGQSSLDQRKMASLQKKLGDKEMSDAVTEKVGTVIHSKLTKNGKSLLETLEENSHKYIAKVKMPNGLYRYFYSAEAYQAYLKRKDYMNDEPEFMKNLPKIDGPSSTLEDMVAINPYYYDSKQKGDGGFTINCMNCTTTYELRKRGYDVQANRMVPSNTTLSAFNKMYKDPVIMRVPNKKDLVSEIENNNPPNSRGNLVVSWRMGGGHSMIWETDSNGKCRILDAQVQTVHDPNYIIDNIRDASYVRTDNLELKEGILDAVTPRKK